MLPLRPPRSAADPGYPERAHLLSDGRACARVHGILVASTLALALAGCGSTPPDGEPVKAQPPAPVKPRTAPTPLGGAPLPAQPMAPLRGEAVAPQPVQPTPLPGGITAPRPSPPAQPTAPLDGDMAAPKPPSPVPLPPPAKPLGQARPEPRPLMGRIIAQEPPPRQAI